MMLTFNKKLIEMLTNKKITTIRIQTPTREKSWDIRSFPTNTVYIEQRQALRLLCSWGELAHLWWRNPRNRSLYCRKIGVSPVLNIDRKLGKYLTETNATQDGFGNLTELIGALKELHNLSRDEVRKTTWYIYRWQPDQTIFQDNMCFTTEKGHWNNCKKKNCPICKELGWISGSIRNKERR